MSDKLLFDVIEEQVAVGFTGKVNILDINSGQIYGHVVLHEGDVLSVMFKNVTGLKALINLLIDESEQIGFKFVVEPEIVNAQEKNIHYPLSVLKKKAEEAFGNYQENKSNIPPKNIKLAVEPSFIVSDHEVSGNEFDLLTTITDYNLIEDIYKNCPLLDYEITNALVSLRRKKALKVIKIKN